MMSLLNFKKWWLLPFLAVIVVTSPPVKARQEKMDLDDIAIKGELQRDNRLTLIGREPAQLKNYVQFRSHFRKEIVEELPRPARRVHYYRTGP